MSGQLRLRIVVTGRVQRVGFRRFVERAARRLGVTGWVRNRSDGAVELLVNGSVASVDQLRRDLREGPPGASVERVEEMPDSGSETLPSPFAVRHQ